MNICFGNNSSYISGEYS